MANFNLSFVWQAVDRFSPTVKNIKRNVSALKRQSAGLSKQIKESGHVFTGAFLGMSAAVGGAVFAAAKFEQELTNVYTLLGKDDLKKFRGDLDKAALSAIKMGFSVDDSSKALFDSVSAIGDVTKSIDVYDTAQKLAIGGVTTLGTSVDGLTSIINAYGKETTKATDVANAFFSAQRAGKTTVALLSSNVGKVAPVAKQAGIGFKTLLAAMSQLTLGGLSTEEASTALRGAIAGLIDPIGEAKAIFKKYKIPVGAAALQSADFVDVLGQIAKVAKKDKDALAKMIPNIRALTAIASLGEPQLKNMRNILSNINKDIEKGTGLNEAYNEQMKTFNNRFKRAKGQLFAVAQSFGVFLLPTLGENIEKMTKFLGVIEKLSPETKAVISILGGLVFAFTALMALVAGALMILPKLAAAWKAITIVMKLGFVFSLGLFAKVIILIGLTVFLLSKLYKHWDDLRTVIDFAAESIANFLAKSDKVSRFINFLAGGIRKIKGAFFAEEVMTERVKKTAEVMAATGFTAKPVASQAAGGKGITDVNINVNAPRGAVKSTSVKTAGDIGDVGFNMAETAPA